MPTLFRQHKPGKDIDPKPPDRPTGATRNGSSRGSKMGANRTSQVRLEVRREFLRTTSNSTQDDVYTSPETLPSIDVAYDSFLRTYPNFSDTSAVDDLRDREFFHLEESQHVCMDYYGFGLFSYYQQIINKATASFGLAYIAANLPTHALYGAADEGTVEFYIRKRVMDYLNINDTEYSMVFTASRGTAFKLLAESYPFDVNRKLLSVYDFESEAVNWMADCAKRKGAKITSASFKWPTLRIGTSHLKKLLQGKKRKSESARGLFVFPVQSRMTGAKYSYQWMSEAQQNSWHVLLDASSLGPKDMDSLGLSLFRPDFIVSSFYKVFGTDPTGFGCLFIKNTVIRCLQNSSRARAVGMVRIVSLSNFTSDAPEVNESEDDSELQLHKRSWGLEQHNEHSLSSFSGPFFPGAEPEVTERPKESNHRHWKSWNRKSKMARHNKGHSARLAGSNGLVHAVSEIGGGGDASPVELVAQPEKSRHYSELTAIEIEGERPNRDNEAGHMWEPTRRLYERSENEIQELEDDDQVSSEVGNSRLPTNSQLHSQGRVTGIQEEYEDDQVSEVGNSRWPTNSQLHSLGRATGIEEEYEPIEFQSLAGRGISPIPEGDVEDQEEERSDSDRYSDAIDTANGSGGAQIGVDEIDEDADLESNSVDDDLGQFDAEAVEDSGRRKWDLSPVEESQQGSGSDRKDPGSEEIPESNLRARRHQDAVKKGSEVENVEESSNSVLSSELSNDVVKRNELSRTMSEPGSRPSPVLLHFHSFERRPSFERHTGKQLSDFQEMGVHGLVQKFQSLSGNAVQKELEGKTGVRGLVQKFQSENSFHKEFEDTVEAKLDLVLDEGSELVRPSYLPPGQSPQGPGSSNEARSPTYTQDVAEVAAKETNVLDENSGHFDTAASSNLTTVTEPSGNTEELRGTVVENGPAHDTVETLSHSPVAGGNSNQQVDIQASATEGNFDLRDRDPAFLENKPGAVSENAHADPLRQVSLVDESERSMDSNIEPMPTRKTAVHNLQHSSSLSGHERTPYESAENFLTILPSRTAKNRRRAVSEAGIEARASESQEQSEKANGSALGSEQREHVPTDSSSPETTLGLEHAAEEGRLFTPSRRSPSIKLDNNLPSINPDNNQAATPNYPSKEESRAGDASLDIANFNDGKDQGFENGRSDLRSNRTLSRDVDFEDEMYPGKRPHASGMFESRSIATVLAEATAAGLNMDDSDDESFFQSHRYSESFEQSRYRMDDLQSASYREDEEGDTDDESETIPEPEVKEDQGEPIISCKGLDFADSLGLSKLNYRLRFLSNWLVSSLLKLRHNSNQGVPLVRIYGPKVKYDRGAGVSFNMFDWRGLLIQPALVQRLADRYNISLGIGRLCNIVDPEMSSDFIAEKERFCGVDEIDQNGANNSPHAGKLDLRKSGDAGESLTIPVVTAAVGFVTSFEDVYKLWSFLAKFLDADYVSQEAWRFHSLNQQIKVM